MNRRTDILLGLGFAAILALPALAQRTAKPGETSPAPEAAPAPGAAAQGGKTYDVRVVFDEDSAKGEILCKQGQAKGGSIEYEKCAKDKLDKYGDVAVKKGIVASKEAYEKLSPKQQEAAKKAAFFDSALDKLKAKIADEAQDKKEESFAAKQYKGMLRQVSKDYKKAVAQCKMAGDLKCPEAAKAAEPAGKPDSAAPAAGSPAPSRNKKN